MRSSDVVGHDPLPARACNGVQNRVGRVLGKRWTIERSLGVGGTAAVYAASHRSGRHVAVKILHQHLTRDTRAKHRFTSEGYAANKVPHPGVVAVLDFEHPSQSYEFILESKQRSGTVLQEHASIRLGNESRKFRDVLPRARTSRDVLDRRQ